MISLVGYTGSGKTTVAEHLGNIFDREVVDVSTLVKELTDDPTDVIDDNELLEWLKQKVDDDPIVVGVREKYLNNCLLGLGYKTIRLKCDEEVRFKRVKEERDYTRQDFIEKDQEEREIGLSEIMLNDAFTSVDASQPVSEVVTDIVKEVEF